MWKETRSRRDFLAVLTGLVAGAVLPPGAAARPSWVPGGRTTRSGAPHPEPRPGVDGSKVLSPDQVAPHVAELFEEIRRIPEVVDGLGCRCGCAEVPGMYSLLSCYEGAGMAQYCDICQGEGRLAVALHAEGRTLDEIRAEIDRRFA